MRRQRESETTGKQLKIMTTIKETCRLTKNGKFCRRASERQRNRKKKNGSAIWKKGFSALAEVRVNRFKKSTGEFGLPSSENKSSSEPPPNESIIEVTSWSMASSDSSVIGIALKIAQNDVPEKLSDKEIYLLDITSLVAGTQFRGQFESRVHIQIFRPLRFFFLFRLTACFFTFHRIFLPRIWRNGRGRIK